MSLKDKLNNLTGLQRIFLVSFILCWIYFALWGSLVKTEDSDKGNRQYGWAVSRDFKNPACLPYTTKPMSELTEPEYGSEHGGNCWHIYTHRKYHDDKIKLPFTEAAYDKNRSSDTLELFLTFFFINTVVVIFGFSLIFGAYKIGNWIFSGFKKDL